MLNLTPRERAVARYLLGGWNYESIAVQLGISSGTVRVNHAQAIIKQTGQDNMLAAVLWILRNAEALGHVMECEWQG